MHGRFLKASKGSVMSIRFKQRGASGYSLVELVVVLAIVGILAIAGVTMIGNRQAGAVRALMDELEGAIGNAHKAAMATGRDVAIVTWGTWDDGTLMMAHGDAEQEDADIRTAANGLLAGAPRLDVLGQTVAVPFRCLPNDAIQTDSIQMRARIVAIGSAQWTNVMSAAANGKTNEDINTVLPFSDGTVPPSTVGLLAGLVNDTNLLFTGATKPHRIVISGSNKRFDRTFIIPVVGTATNGGALPGGPMGLIVVQANGGSVYRFYNPGVRDSDGKWRRI